MAITLDRRSDLFGVVFLGAIIVFWILAGLAAAKLWPKVACLFGFG